MAETSRIIVENEHILKNLAVINRHADKILGRVIDPPLKKYMRGFMNTTSGMKKYPGASASPVDWQSPKQQRAFFATDGFGGGIPTQRTGELFRHFGVRTDRRELTASIVNTAEWAKYLIGDRQQRQHAATGYKKMETYEDAALKGAIPVASKALESEIALFLFKRGL